MTAVMLRLLWKQYFENGAKRYSGVVSDSSLVLLFTKKIEKTAPLNFAVGLARKIISISLLFFFLFLLFVS